MVQSSVAECAVTRFCIPISPNSDARFSREDTYIPNHDRLRSPFNPRLIVNAATDVGQQEGQQCVALLTLEPDNSAGDYMTVLAKKLV